MNEASNAHITKLIAVHIASCQTINTALNYKIFNIFSGTYGLYRDIIHRKVHHKYKAKFLVRESHLPIQTRRKTIRQETWPKENRQ